MIDSRAVVSSQAEIAKDVEIGPFSIIGADVKIDSGTVIGSHAVIKGPTTIGKNNRIHQFATVGDDPQDKKYAGEPTQLIIGDNNVIREYATVHRGTVQDKGITQVGNHCLLMAYTHIAHDCILGDHIIMSNAASLGGHVKVGDWSILSGFSIVHQFCVIGSHSFLGMGSAITKDVPPYVLVSGQPGEPHGINSNGLKRRDFSEDQIKNIKKAYRILYKSGLKLLEAKLEIGKLAENNTEIRLFNDFFECCERSIIR